MVGTPENQSKNQSIFLLPGLLELILVIFSLHYVMIAKMSRAVQGELWVSNKECRLKRHELRKLASKKHQDPLNTIIREQYHDTLAQYKKLLNSKKNDYYNAKISELEKTADNSDAKTFWQCLKSMDDTRKGEDVPSMSEENWLQYFHNLHSN